MSSSYKIKDCVIAMSGWMFARQRECRITMAKWDTHSNSMRYRVWRYHIPWICCVYRKEQWGDVVVDEGKYFSAFRLAKPTSTIFQPSTSFHHSPHNSQSVLPSRSCSSSPIEFILSRWIECFCLICTLWFPSKDTGVHLDYFWKGASFVHPTYFYTLITQLPILKHGWYITRDNCQKDYRSLKMSYRVGKSDFMLSCVLQRRVSKHVIYTSSPTALISH